MALLDIQIEDFRGKENVTYNFSSGMNRITGKNGVGKTTIGEAICFLFTGTDSAGTKNPSHLISDDKDALKVTGRTTKSQIVRTLTRKGNSTIKVIKNDMATTMTQTQLETMIGSTDLFLSCFLPEFFLNLSTERQHKVISEVSPKVDRYALFADIAGFELTAEEKIRYALTRRIDLVSSDVSKDRRELEKQSQQEQGKITALEGLKPLPLPTEGLATKYIAQMKIVKSGWDDYKVNSNTYNQALMANERATGDNHRRARRRDEITAQLATIVMLPKPEYVPEDVEAIRAQMLRHPAEPALLGVVDAESCPTCSQVVALKHRERCQKQNEELIAAYKLEDAKITAHNNAVQENIKTVTLTNDELRKAYLNAIDSNQKTAALNQRLTIELTNLKDVEVPPLPAAPAAPEEVFDAVAYAAAEKEESDYKAACAQYEYVKTQSEQAAAKIATSQALIAKLAAHIEHLSLIEKALETLPQVELQAQASGFDLGDVKLLVGTEITAYVDGKPLKLVSTGNKMKACCKICRKLDAMNPRPIGMVFLDNADLVDHIDLENTQLFLALVVPDQAEVLIDNNNNKT